jgi:hypothetical protein
LTSKYQKDKKSCENIPVEINVKKVALGFQYWATPWSYLLYSHPKQENPG